MAALRRGDDGMTEDRRLACPWLSFGLFLGLAGRRLAWQMGAARVPVGTSLRVSLSCRAIFIPLATLLLIGAAPLAHAQSTVALSVGGEASASQALQPAPALSALWGSTVVNRASKPKKPLQTARAKPVPVPPLPTATRAVVSAKGDSSTFSLFLSRSVSFKVFTLADPYRVVIDLPQVDFQLPVRGRRFARGLVKDYRFGLFAPGKSRIVLDTAGPVVVRKAAQIARGSGSSVLAINLELTDEIGFLLKPPPRKAARSRPSAAQARKRRPTGANKRRPVIVIDAGHGGVDAGAVGVSKIYEKQITMAVARRLRATLRRSKRYVVRMTRASDTFVSLDDRVEYSRKVGADLFISIHADAVANKAAAATVRGATVYTLSERASDEQARQLAIKENAVDIMAGIQVHRAKKDRQVRTILIDLLKRETANFSTNFSNLLLKQFKGRIPLHAKASKAAAFHVLKQTQSPSVLIELGYMSNRKDVKMLSSGRWQRKVAKSIAKAVDKYFAKRVAGSR